MKKCFVVLSVLLVSVSLAACDLNKPTPIPMPTWEPTATAAPPTKTPEPTKEPTNTPEPTEEPTNTPEPTAEPAALPKSLSNLVGGYSLQYPDGWAVMDFLDFSMLAASEEALSGSNPASSGPVVIVFTTAADDLETDDPLEALMAAVEKNMTGETTEVVAGPESVVIQGQKAAAATVKGTGDDGTPLTGYMALIIGQGEGAGRAGIVIGMAPAEMAEETVPIFRQIANTMVVTAPAEVEDESGQTMTDAPNNQGVLLYGDTVSGEIAAGEVFVWNFTGLAGETIDIIVAPDGALDVIVDVLDEDGGSILENGAVDDSFDTEEILGLTLPADGEYSVVVSGFADTAGTYELAIGESGAVSAPAAGRLTFGATISGTVTEETTAVSWNFMAKENELIGVVVRVFDGLDAVLDVVDANGNSILANVRDATFGDENLLIDIPADGEYSIQVMGYDGSTGSFDLTLGYPMRNSVFASAALTEEEVGLGDVYPFIALAGDMVGIVVAPEDGLDTAVLVEQDGVVVEGIGYAPDRGFDTLEGERYVFIVPEDGVYQFVVRNSVDEDFGGNAGTYDVELYSSPTTIFELAHQDAAAAATSDLGYVEYAIRGKAGQTLTLEVAPIDEFDVMVRLVNSNGDLLQEATNDAGAGETETVVYTFDEDGLLFIQVHDAAGAAGSVFVMTTTLE